jgi:opacity protein-like surface antigen
VYERPWGLRMRTALRSRSTAWFWSSTVMRYSSKRTTAGASLADAGVGVLAASTAHCGAGSGLSRGSGIRRIRWWFEKRADGVEVRQKDGVLRLEVKAEDVLHVTYSPLGVAAPIGLRIGWW